MSHIRRFSILLTTATLVFGQAAPTWAKYAMPQVEQVPVERLVENLTKQADAKPKDATIRLNLARVHAMSYAQKSASVETKAGDKDNGAYFGPAPAHIPFHVQKTEDAAKEKAAKEQLAAAIADYQKAVELAPDNPTAQLGYAWCLDQAGEKDKAIAEYRKTIKNGWDAEKDIDKSVDKVRTNWHSVVLEASEYLKPYLDADKDKAELADLQAKGQKIKGAMMRLPITPIAIPLQADLTASDIEARDAKVSFNADGNGSKSWSWIKPNAAWLVYDHRDAGKPDSGLQLFGNVTFWCFWDNGYQALRSLDNNGDGQLTGEELQHLALWHDANGNGIADPGEVKPLAEYGIVALSCECKTDDAHPDHITFSPAGVTFRNGETRPTFDVILHQKGTRRD